jgi:hypothetical protein
MLFVQSEWELDMAATEEKSAAADPFESFRDVRDAYLEGMSKVMINAVNTEQYAQATGAMLNGCLTFLAPFREALDKAMVMALEQFSMPSQQQLASLAERFTNLEMRLDDLDAKLDRLIELSASRSPEVSVPPPTLKRPAAADAKSSHRAGTSKM